MNCACASRSATLEKFCKNMAATSGGAYPGFQGLFFSYLIPEAQFISS